CLRKESELTRGAHFVASDLSGHFQTIRTKAMSKPKKHKTKDSALGHELKKAGVVSGSHAGGTTTYFMKQQHPVPNIVDRREIETKLRTVRGREEAHRGEGDAIAAARRRLPMVEVDGTLKLIGSRGVLTLLEAFEGRRQLIAYYFMWHTGHPAAEQCEGCTWVIT